MSLQCVSATKKELEAVKKKFMQSSEQIMDKGRQYQKLQVRSIDLEVLASVGVWVNFVQPKDSRNIPRFKSQ